MELLITSTGQGFEFQWRTSAILQNPVAKDLLKTLCLHCCSERFGQLPNRISGYFSSGWFGNRPELVHSLWQREHRRQHRPSARRHLPSLGHIPLRHRSKCGHPCREALHRRSLRAGRRSVCSSTGHRGYGLHLRQKLLLLCFVLLYLRH